MKLVSSIRPACVWLVLAACGGPPPPLSPAMPSQRSPAGTPFCQLLLDVGLQVPCAPARTLQPSLSGEGRSAPSPCGNAECDLLLRADAGAR
jgi:hypothetical protein